MNPVWGSHQWPLDYWSSSVPIALSGRAIFKGEWGVYTVKLKLNTPFLLQKTKQRIKSTNPSEYTKLMWIDTNYFHFVILFKIQLKKFFSSLCNNELENKKTFVWPDFSLYYLVKSDSNFKFRFKTELYLIFNKIILCNKAKLFLEGDRILVPYAQYYTCYMSSTNKACLKKSFVPSNVQH